MRWSKTMTRRNNRRKSHNLPRGVRASYNGRFYACTGTTINKERCYRTIGSFETPERAALAFRLFSLWRERGYDFYDIPTQPRTVDAI